MNKHARVKSRNFWAATVIVALFISCRGRDSRSAPPSVPLESIVEAELNRLGEVHRILERYSQELWPGWRDYGDIPVKVNFPNGVILLVAPRADGQPGFERIPGRAVSGNNVYINLRNRTSAEIRPPLIGMGRGGELIQMELGQPDLPSLESERSAALEARLKDRSRPEVPFDLVPLGDSDSHVLMYIHEYFHGHQACLQRPGPVWRLKINAEYAAWAHVEGLALHRAYLESQDAAALDFLKDFTVAREIKRAHMPHDAVLAEVYLSMKEGTASYVSLKTAMLLRGSNDKSWLDRAKDPFFYKYAYLDGYVDNIMRKGMDFAVSRTEDSQGRYYLYGAYQCFLLDRFAPGWKRGFLEKKNDLDSAMAALLSPSSGEKTKIKQRLSIRYGYDEILELHKNALKNARNH